MKKIIELYQKFGLNVIPTLDKIPLVKWTEYKTKFFDGIIPNNANGLALICGEFSGNIEVIDLDLKNDYKNEVWTKFIAWCPAYLKEKFVIQTTPNKGAHLFYKLEKSYPSKILARIYNKEILIETRGEGSLCTVYPSPNYKIIQGKFSELQVLEEIEREELFRFFGRFNEYIEPPKKQYTPKFTFTDNQDSEFDKFNRKNPIGLLISKGWAIVKENSLGYHLKRPNTQGKWTSATLIQNDAGVYVLYVFSTSTEFEPEKPYTPSQILNTYTNDWKQTYSIIKSS